MKKCYNLRFHLQMWITACVEGMPTFTSTHTLQNKKIWSPNSTETRCHCFPAWIKSFSVTSNCEAWFNFGSCESSIPAKYSIPWLCNDCCTDFERGP